MELKLAGSTRLIQVNLIESDKVSVTTLMWSTLCVKCNFHFRKDNLVSIKNWSSVRTFRQSRNK